MSNVKAHTRYKLKSGKVCPSVTTIIDSSLGWNKRVLLGWSRKECMKGNDPDLILRDTGEAGTCAHLLIESYVRGTKPDLCDFTERQIVAGKSALVAYQSWERSHPLEYVHLEHQVVSEEFRFGGTIDIIARDDSLWLIDLKTRKAVYPEMVVQIAAYGRGYIEQSGAKIDQYHLLRLSKSGSGYEHHVISPERIEVAWSVFKHCRELYGLQKQMKGAL